MSRYLTRVGGIAVAFVAIVVSGCGSDMHPVEGRFVWPDGSPAKELAGSHVVFERPGENITSRGIVQPDGSFRLTTLKEFDGAPSGEYKVALLENRQSANREGTVLVPELVDTMYADLNTSGLTATVQRGPNTLTITIERVKQVRK